MFQFQNIIQLIAQVNSFALRADNNGEEENVGTALYRANSIFDHSCQPNATTVFSGKIFIVQLLYIHPWFKIILFWIWITVIRSSFKGIFIGKKLYIKSIVSSPSLDLSQFYIAYLDHSIPRDARRNRLR